MPSFPHFLQRNQMDCGPTCLYIISKYYGRAFGIEKLRELTEIGKEGVNILGISDAAEKIGFRTLAVQPTLQQLNNDIKLPCILHWSQNHFVVLYKIRKNSFYVSDPGKSSLRYTETEFAEKWLSNHEENENTGIALTLEPTPLFFKGEFDEDYYEQKGKGIGNIISYLFPYKKLIVQLMLGLFGKSTQIDPRSPLKSDPLSPEQTDPLWPA